MAEVLTFTTDRKRRTIRIDDEKIEMLDKDELDLAGALRLQETIDMARRAKTPEDGAKASAELKAAMHLLLVSPRAEALKRLERLTDNQRLRIVVSFLGGPEVAPPVPTEPTEPAQHSGGY